MTSIEVDDADAIRAMVALETFVSVASMAGFLEGPVAEFLQGRIEGRFAGEGDDASGAWEALMPSTERIRAGHGFAPDHPINERTGNLRGWLMEHGTLEVAPDEIVYATPGDASFGGDAWLETKLATAQEGRDDPLTVARPVLALSETDAQGVAELIAQWFLDTTAALGVNVEML